MALLNTILARTVPVAPAQFGKLNVSVYTSFYRTISQIETACLKWGCKTIFVKPLTYLFQIQNLSEIVLWN